MTRVQKRSGTPVAVVGLGIAGALTISASAFEVLDTFEDADDVGWTHFTVPEDALGVPVGFHDGAQVIPGRQLDVVQGSRVAQTPEQLLSAGQLQVPGVAESRILGARGFVVLE